MKINLRSENYMKQQSIKKHKMVSIQENTYKKLESLKKEGQSFDGVIRELLKECGVHDDKRGNTV